MLPEAAGKPAECAGAEARLEARDRGAKASSRTGRMLGNKTCDKEWVPQPFTLHGFRTSLTTWAQEQDNGRLYPMPIIKTAIAHNATENESDTAYLRSDHFKARRELMEHWSRFVTGS